MVATITGVTASKWLILITRLHLLLRGTVRTLLAICIILCLRTLLWGITALSIWRGVGVQTTKDVSLGSEYRWSSTYLD